MTRKIRTAKDTALQPVGPRMAALAEAGRLTSRNADKHWLYQNSVQNPSVEVPFIDRVFANEFGRKPSVLREDFCGTALLCSWWVKARATNRAIGVDFDGPTLEWGRVNNLAPLGAKAERVTLIQDDVRSVRAPKADVLMASNFSWWGFKTRDELAVYLRNCRASLKPEGILVMDCYGGPEAQVVQEEQRDQDGFTYVWDQDHFNPVTGEVRCLIHFDFPTGPRMTRAFTYDWRLWHVPETCDLLRECGFSRVMVYWEGTDRKGEPNGVFRVSTKGDLAPAWIAYMVAVR
ncbi:MAG: class I SAM-dependent methyltransferase [bacterium]|nr:class I SAM-dependent methyltransferase [bacterium]